MTTPTARNETLGSIDETAYRDGSLRVSITVVIPVYNRSTALGELLGALGGQTYPRDRFEVLVVDDGSTEDLRPEVEQAAHALGWSAVYLRQPNAGPGAARNLGLAHATGEVVVFTDSDCLPSPCWLEAFARALTDPAVNLAGGFVDFRTARHLSGRCINFIANSTLGAAGAVDPRAFVHMDYYPRTLNMAVRRDLARAVGGFTRHSHGEDLDFSYRVATFSGSPPRFVPEATIVHNEQRSPAQVFRENVRKGAARVRLSADHGMHEPVHVLPALLVLYLLALPLLLAIRPGAAPLALPALGYALILGLLGLQGASKIDDPRAILAVPAYAALIHFGYGLGYLAAVGRRLARRAAGPPHPNCEPCPERPVEASTDERPGFLPQSATTRITPP